jgi:hypothetical protein
MGGLWPLRLDCRGDDGGGKGGLQSGLPQWPSQIEEGLIGECEAEHQNVSLDILSPAPATLGMI